jgi:hypothetical protein
MVKSEALSLPESWIYVQKEHLKLPRRATDELVLSEPHVCEEIFSAVAANKSKLVTAYDLRYQPVWVGFL